MLWQTDTLLLSIGRLFSEGDFDRAIAMGFDRFDVTLFCQQRKSGTRQRLARLSQCLVHLQLSSGFRSRQNTVHLCLPNLSASNPER